MDSMGFKQPSPIQEQSIPLVLAGHDLIACAQTGTGKTGAYLLPVIHKIMAGKQNYIDTLILAPTRELAQQIDLQIEGFAYFCSISSISIYGGGDGKIWSQQEKALRGATDIITATPGRLIALLASGEIKLDKIKHLILDEADRMLDMGFYDDLMKIISALPANRQTLLFSATMPPKIRTLAGKILKNPESVSIAISKPAEKIVQQAYVVHDTQKDRLIKMILENDDYQSVIVFASTKENVKKLDITLRKAGLSVKAFHSDLEQAEREQILREFKNRSLRILVGTDILSRGIDVEGISLVINYDSPPDPEDYVHRIGRTARASTDGTAITFINEKDQKKFARIEQLIGKEVDKLPVPEELGPGPEYNPDKKLPKSFTKRPSHHNKFKGSGQKK